MSINSNSMPMPASRQSKPTKCDLAITGGRVFNDATLSFENNDIFIGKDGRILEVRPWGRWSSTLSASPPRRKVDVKGRYVLPGFIDSHVHLESSMVSLSEFAKAVVAHGTTTMILDPHEICNVLGASGLELLIRESMLLPVNSFFAVPSCVPASPLDSGGATMDAKTVSRCLKLPRVVALGEVMNFPGVLNNDPEVMAKIHAAKKLGLVINGHSPGLSGKKLKQYVAAGINDDHESFTELEAVEKIGCGLKVMIREGSAASSSREFFWLMNNYWEDLLFCTDDKHVNDIVREGHINRNLHLAVHFGADAAKSIKCATANAADHYKLSDITGRIKAGLQADLAIVSDLEKFEPSLVISRGVIAAVNGKAQSSVFPERFSYPSRAMMTVKCRNICEKDLEVTLPPSGGPIRVMVASEGSLYTAEKTALSFSVQKDVLKIAAVNRYQKTAKPRLAVGAIQGFGIKEGAICSTVAHDCHNIICVGSSDSSMVSAINATIRTGGGMNVYDAKKKKVTGTLMLPLAGLMSIGGFEKTSRDIEKLDAAASAIGCEMEHPFSVISFMALEVIPKLKITTRGLVDVESFSYVPLVIEKEK